MLVLMERPTAGRELPLLQSYWSWLVASPEIMQMNRAGAGTPRVDSRDPEKKVAEMDAGTPAGVELRCCSLPPDVSLQLSQSSLVLS